MPDWEWHCTRDEYLDLMRTSGALAQLPPDKVAEVVGGVGPAIDALGGGFTLSITTVALIAARPAPPGHGLADLRSRGISCQSPGMRPFRPV